MLFSLQCIAYILIILILLKIIKKVDDKENVDNGETNNLFDRFIKKEIKPSKEDIRVNKILDNIENYKGSSDGQKKIK